MKLCVAISDSDGAQRRVIDMQQASLVACYAFAALFSFFVLATSARAADRRPLIDEVSRDELALYAQSKDVRRAFPKEFKFPNHVVKDRIFGIDVSHYQGGIKWDRVAGQGVRFAYVKA